MIDVKDILLDEDNDLLIANGDFVVNFSDNQHQQHLIEAYKGHYKEYPLVGVGLPMYLKSAGKDAEIKREITIQLEDDKYLIDTVSVVDRGEYFITVKAKRIS